MCLAALWSSVGNGAKAVVAGPAGAAFAGPTFLVEYAFNCVPLSGFGSFFFEFTSDFISSCDNLLKHSERCVYHKVLKQAVTEIWVMGCVAGKPKVVAFQQQRRRPACKDAQSGQRLCCSISRKYN